MGSDPRQPNLHKVICFEYIIVFRHTENVPEQLFSFEIDKDEMRFTTKGLEFPTECLSINDPPSQGPQNGGDTRNGYRNAYRVFSE